MTAAQKPVSAQAAIGRFQRDRGRPVDRLLASIAEAAFPLHGSGGACRGV